MAFVDQRPAVVEPALAGRTVAVARDAAYGFIYPANLDTLRALGAELAFFSPLAGETLAADSDALWLPGGYPELHGGALACNARFWADVRAHVAAGKPVLAECGGLMSLLETIVDKAGTTQFEWVQTTMVKHNKIGERVVDAVAQKDKKLIYIDQEKFVDLTQSKRMFLLTHELFHMDTFDGKNLDDEDPIGPFKYQYGIRDLLNAAAAGITLTSIDETVFQDYSKYLSKSRSTRRHWVSLMTASTPMQDDRATRFKTSMDHGARFSYQYQFPNLFNFGLTLHLQNQSGEKSSFTSTRIKQKTSTKAVGITYRYFLFNNLDPVNHFWNTFVQFEILTERLDANFNMDDGYTNEDSSTSSTSPAARMSVYFPMKHDFWINTGVSFSDHKAYFQAFDYNLSSNGPTFF